MRECSISLSPKNKQSNSVVWVRERTIPTERPPLVGEVSANFCGWGCHDVDHRSQIDCPETEPALLNLSTFGEFTSDPDSWLPLKTKLNYIVILPHNVDSHLYGLYAVLLKNERWATSGVSRVRFQAKARNVSLLQSVPKGSGDHPASCQTYSGGFFARSKAAEACSWPLNI
jgi:hypothetical protein